MGVKIEIFRMMLYLSFPVTMFWISNQAEYFEEYIVKRKRETFPPDEESQRKELENFKERMRARKEQQLLKKMTDNWRFYVLEKYLKFKLQIASMQHKTKVQRKDLQG